MISRRALLQAGALPALAAPARKPVAAIITEYRRNAHADVIVGRILDGYEYYGQRRTSRLQVVSMYTDQVPENDLSRAMAQKHNVPIHKTVREALTLGGSSLAVEGVVLVGEHGKYPHNEKGQHLYPRYELYRQVIEVFESSRRAVPVFCDKHLSVDWDKARWMYDQSRRWGFPLLAGSSLPVTWRRPPLELDLGVAVEHAVVGFHGPKEAYGFHALEALQCMVERRKGGETGVTSVQCLEDGEVWRWTDAHDWAEGLLRVAEQRADPPPPGDARQRARKPILMLVDYADGLKAAVYILNNHLNTCVFAASLRGRAEPVSTQIWLQGGRPFSHFSSLTHYIEELIVNRREPYPVERTLLTTGVLAALMDSSFQKGRRLATPHLAIRYKAPRRSLFNRGAVPALEGA